MREEDLDEEFQKLDEVELKEIEKNEQVKQLISSQTSIFKTITVGKVEIRIKAYMPRAARIKLIRAGTALSKVKTEDEVIKVEKRLYPLVAAMCLDDPFNKPQTWIYVDEKTGCVQDVMFKILKEVTKTDGEIKSFRGK